MNFFEHQDQARQNTQRLVLLYILSVICIVFSIYSAALVTSGIMMSKTPRYRFNNISPRVLQYDPNLRRRIWVRPADIEDTTITGKSDSRLLQPGLFLLVAIPTVLVIGGTSWLKLQSLKKGGSVVAQQLGGRLILPEIAGTNEQQLLNVVAEMAIAAGIPTPAVYLLDGEGGINAFAAGYSTNDAVIGITRGCLEQLNRDELQAVVGHEFSHILNGDMRLNMSLIGAIHGIVLIYLLGRILIQFRSGRNWNAWVFFGVSLMVIGSLGQLFSRLIQSGVSRQREFLADASAVQFTRNPEGLKGALEKIENNMHRSLVRSPYAEEMSHLFFGSAVGSAWLQGDWFATHPPLEQRIRRLNSSIGRYAARMPIKDVSRQPINGANPMVAPDVAATPEILSFTGNQATEDGVTPPPAIAPVYSTQAQQLLAKLSESMREKVRSHQGSLSLVYALLLDPENALMQTQQLNWLRQAESVEVVENTSQFSKELELLDAKLHLQLLDLTIPVLRQSSATECQKLFKCVQSLAKMDGRWSLNEFIIYLILWHELETSINPLVERSEIYTTLEAVWNDCLIVLSAISQVGQTNQSTVAFIFRSGLYKLPGVSQQTLPEVPPAYNFSDLKKSLERLRRASPKLQQAIFDACTEIVLMGKKVNLEQADLLRAIAIVINCPPPSMIACPHN
ncbi:MAG TPA: M48 family metallopeptidase [Oculatellaceae cyanobacterium]|jgi:Zn-dependent protease with chaperone function